MDRGGDVPRAAAAGPTGQGDPDLYRGDRARAGPVPRGRRQCRRRLMERDAVNRFRAPYIQECRILTARGPASALASNVSLNGLFIVVDEVLDLGQRVQVS